ncbi:hypothetical protein [Nocardia sp. NPDC052566]|uniref:hypothetical protein n=1 Tax=Nocardia sp. NPDC052566 TaxID=3364330 RepID=UPI0037C6749F
MSTVRITGTVHQDGRFIAGWWHTTSDIVEAISEPDTGWAAIAVDSTGRVLEFAPATLETVPVCRRDGDSTARLTAMLPLVEETASIAVVHDDVEVFRREVPPPATVSLDLTAVRGKTSRRSLIEIPVQIDRAEPPPGAHLIARLEAPDSGCPAMPLPLVDVGAGEPPVVRFDLAELPSADRYRLTVSYSDGVRTVTVTSPALQVEQRPASPEISVPDTRTVRYDDELLVLEGRINGDADPAALRWLIDNETVGHGPVAHVACLSAGEHTVSLQLGGERHQIEITVRPAPELPVQRPSHWEPPWRAGAVRVVGVAHASEEFS